MTKRGYGDGAIGKRGENTYRLRYRVSGQRFTKTFRGSLSEARTELRRLLRTGDTGEHIAPDKVTVAEWIDRWIALLEHNRRTIERYRDQLRLHIIPAVGARPLQKIEVGEIDAVYQKLKGTLAPATLRHLHVVLGSCFKAAVRKGLITSSPVARATAPSPGESDRGIALDQQQLQTLLAGFKHSPIFPIIATLAFTGARRNEILALRWSDLDIANKTLRIERTLEKTDKIRTKEPKSQRGRRTIAIDTDLLELLRAERQKHLRIRAGIADGVAVDLSLIQLPADALMFPSPPTVGISFSFTRPYTPDNITKGFSRRAHKLGFPRVRLHDLRTTHATWLLDAGVPVHTVAARLGHDASILLRTYAKHTKKADTSAAAVIGALSKGVLG